MFVSCQGGLNPEKVEVGGEKCGSGPKGRGLKGWARRVEARNLAFFPLPPQFSFFIPSLGGLLVELWPRFKAEFHTKCAFGLLWSHFVKPRRFHEKTHPREGRKNENCGGKKKKSEILGGLVEAGPREGGPKIGSGNFTSTSCSSIHYGVRFI